MNDGMTLESSINLSDGNQIIDNPESIFDYSYLRTPKIRHPKPEHGAVGIVDVFCGCGGLSLGAKEACATLGMIPDIRSAIDFDEEIISVYKDNFPNAATLTQDICEVVDGELGQNATKAEKQYTDEIGNYDILLSGPPCQGHSDLNNYTRRRDGRNTLYERIARFAEISSPNHIIVENVPAVVHGEQGSLQKAVIHLRKLGYQTQEDTIDLSQLGVPQKRRRHVLFATKSDFGSVNDIISKYYVNAVRSVGWAIEDLSQSNGNSIFTRPSKHNEDNLKRMKFLIQNGLYDLPDKLRPKCHRDGNHTYRAMYGRLNMNKPAPTITSGFTSPGQGRFVHPMYPRTITPHEAARLQFFPDFFKFSEAKQRTSLANMIGNAVPMKLSFILCLEILLHTKTKQYT